MTDNNLRRTRVISWTIVIAAVLVVFDYITGAQFLAFAGGLIQGV